MTDDRPDRCARCGRDIDPGDGFWLTGPAEGEQAAFCRLEHIVAWVLRGATWDATGAAAAKRPVLPSEPCAQCGRTPARLVLVRRRLGRTVTDGFCSPEHLRAWASAGGRWAAR